MPANGEYTGVTSKESIKAAVMHRCPYYYVLEDVMLDHASSTPLSTMSSIGNLKILDDDGRAGEADTPTFKRVVGDLPTLKKEAEKIAQQSILRINSALTA